MIYRPEGEVTPSEETIRQCWSRNPHGGGVMWQQDGILWFIKGMMTIEDMLVAIAQVPPNVVAAFHFRIGTNGANDESNTHPWYAGNGRMLMHNGIIGFLAGDKEVSDSKRCGELVAKVDIWDDEVRMLVANAIGWNNKLIVMDGTNSAIVNKAQGVWEGGCWYSNTSFEIYKAPIPRVWDYEDGSFQQKLLGPAPKLEDAQQIRHVSMEKDKVTLTFLYGTQTTIPPQEFIALYDEFEYVPGLRLDIDRRVAQYAIRLERIGKNHGK